MPLFTGSEPLYLSFSLFPHKTPHSTSAYSNSGLLSGAATDWVGLCFVFGAQGGQSYACVWLSLSHSGCCDAGLSHTSSSQGDHYLAKLSGI